MHSFLHHNSAYAWKWYLLCPCVGCTTPTCWGYFKCLCEMCVGTWVSSGLLAMTGREAHWHPLSLTKQSTLQSTVQWRPYATTVYPGGNTSPFVRLNSRHVCHLHPALELSVLKLVSLYVVSSPYENKYTHKCSRSKSKNIVWQDWSKCICNETVAAGVCVKPVCPAVTLSYAWADGWLNHREPNNH